MAASAVILNIVIMNIYYWFDLNKDAILNFCYYGDLRGNFVT